EGHLAVADARVDHQVLADVTRFHKALPSCISSQRSTIHSIHTLPVREMVRHPQTAPAKNPYFHYPEWTHLHGLPFKEEPTMPSKPDLATLLAEKLLHTLEAQRALGADAYPLTLRRLAELSDPQAPPELVLKAAGKRPFADA